MEQTKLSRSNPDIAPRGLFFGGWVAMWTLLFAGPVIALIHLSLSNSDDSHIILIPFLTACFIYIERRIILRSISSGLRLGFLLLGLGIGALVWIVVAGRVLTADLDLFGYIGALILIWAAGFAFCFGRAASRQARFAGIFLLLMLPLPNVILHWVIYVLQVGSTYLTGALFDLFAIPALREGFVFHLASVNIEITKECSGIRSSVALLIFVLPVIHFGMQRAWKKALFLICALLMMLVKNAIRIVTLTVLSIYVDPAFLYGKLHYEGGIAFFLLVLLLLLPVYLLLQDRHPKKRGVQPAPVLIKPH